MKRFSLYLLLPVALCLLPFKANAAVVPGDVATIEALIELHKTMMDIYKSAMVQEEITATSQFSVKEMAKKYNNVMSNLHLKMAKGYAYLQLAAVLARLAEDSYDTIRKYEQFTEQAYSLAKSKPFSLFRYAEVTNNCIKRVKRIKNLIVSNTEITSNLFRCDDKRRMQFVLLLEGEIDGLHDYINYQLFNFQMMNAGYIRYDSIWDIMNNEVLERAAAEAIACII